MPGKCTDQGENDCLTKWIKNGYTTLYLGLYENTTEPAENAALTGLTEQSGSGYARIALASAVWTVVNDTVTNLEKTFTASGGDWGNQYGYFIATTSDNTGLLLFVEQFSNGPYDVTNGSTVKITPKIMAA